MTPIRRQIGRRSANGAFFDCFPRVRFFRPPRFVAAGLCSAFSQDINDYSKKYHHQQNPLGVAGADAEPIDSGELTAFVKRTLAFVTS
jgi:hypothetical protein